MNMTKEEIKSREAFEKSNLKNNFNIKSYGVPKKGDIVFSRWYSTGEYDKYTVSVYTKKGIDENLILTCRNKSRFGFLLDQVWAKGETV